MVVTDTTPHGNRLYIHKHSHTWMRKLLCVHPYMHTRAHTLKTMARSKFFSEKPTRSRDTMLTSARVMQVKGISVSSTKQLTVGISLTAVLCGTPSNISSRKGTSNSRSKSLRRSQEVTFGHAEVTFGHAEDGQQLPLAQVRLGDVSVFSLFSSCL